MLTFRPWATLASRSPAGLVRAAAGLFLGRAAQPTGRTDSKNMNTIPVRQPEQGRDGRALPHRPLMLALWACVGLAGPGLLCGAGRAVDRPNIVVIVADDLGYGEAGCFGGTEIPTPHLDALAARGVRFSSAYVTAPLCAPSRAAMLTGRYQTRFGHEFNPVGAVNAEPSVGLPSGVRTLGDHLRQAGYATALVGKWHLGGTARYHPNRRGFDEFFGFLHEGHSFAPYPGDGHVSWLRRMRLPDGGLGRWSSPDGRVVWTTHMGHREPDYDADNPVLRASQPVDERENLTDAFTREAGSFVARHRGQPFYLHLAYNAVHSPMQGADGYMERFAHITDMHRRIFAAMLAQLDEGVGRVLARIRAEGLEDRTMVVFLSDNGGATRELTSRNTPWRGEKGQLLEGGIRVPMLMAWPGHVPAGRVEAAMVSALDIVPTALAAAGVPAPAELDGVNLLPGLKGATDQPFHAELYWRMGRQAALRAGDWKIVRDRATGSWQLYHLSADPGEARDLAGTDPDRLAALVARWETLDAAMVPPAWSSAAPGS